MPSKNSSHFFNNPPQLQSNIAVEKRKLRTEIRKRRRSLSQKQQKTASHQLISILKNKKQFLSAQHIALYLGNDGEICPKALIPLLRKWKKQAYLPVIHPLRKNEIVFCLVKQDTPFKHNRFDIPEPVFSRCQHRPAKHLSTILLPLVAFDESGNRMGMGGGFYDRALAFKHKKKTSRPRLIGLAHDFQKQPKLPIEAWDVPLHGVVTEKRYYQHN
jgi:5-formyltetrahydrofolate cyclo-ligase